MNIPADRDLEKFQITSIPMGKDKSPFTIRMPFFNELDLENVEDIEFIIWRMQEKLKKRKLEIQEEWDKQNQLDLYELSTMKINPFDD